MHYATLSQAAEAAGIRQSVLTAQISRLERDVGAELYIRAVRGQPMRLTHQGRALVTALAQMPVR
jgi:DNA-binding transcriptional LysR family regulator